VSLERADERKCCARPLLSPASCSSALWSREKRFDGKPRGRLSAPSWPPVCRSGRTLIGHSDGRTGGFTELRCCARVCLGVEIQILPRAGALRAANRVERARRLRSSELKQILLQPRVRSLGELRLRSQFCLDRVLTQRFSLSTNAIRWTSARFALFTVH